MIKRTQKGAGAIILTAFILSAILVGVAVVLQMNKSKEIERVVATEYNLKTYYVALAGINECIASRMAPRSNVLLKRNDVNDVNKDKYERLVNSGYVYANPYEQNQFKTIGEYTYVSYVVVKDENGQYNIDEFNNNWKDEKYLVYSKGVTQLPDGSKDSVIIKTIFDLNRFDNDTSNADEIEEFKIIPPSDPETKMAEGLIEETKKDNDPPMVREIKFNDLMGSEISVGLHDKKDKVEIENVGVRSKVEIIFTEPIDARFLEGINITNIKSDKPVDTVEKVVLSPKNTEVVLLPPEKSDGRILDYDTTYRLDISKVSDYNGNRLPEGPEIIFKTESPSYEGVVVKEAFDDGCGGCTGKGVDGRQKGSAGTDSNPFGNPFLGSGGFDSTGFGASNQSGFQNTGSGNAAGLNAPVGVTPKNIASP